MGRLAVDRLTALLRVVGRWARQTVRMAPRRPQLQSTFARAVVPVAAGIVFFALLGLMLWGVAALISNSDAEVSNDLSTRTFSPGPTAQYADYIATDGPVLFPDLLGTDGDETYVLDHTGDDAASGWRLYLAHPVDKPVSCKVVQEPGTRTFTDCDGRQVDVAVLAPPPCGIKPVVSADGRTLDLDLIIAPNEVCAG
jgi:hypothetical protein